MCLINEDEIFIFLSQLVISTMTIYLHCGGHKTASSFMKIFLHKNRELFESQGIAIHLDRFRDRDISAKDIIDLARQDYQNNYQQIIISEDANIIGLMPGIFSASDRNFFYPKSILQFANLIAEVNREYPTRFLLCVRRQDTYLESCYKFRKTHGAKYSLTEFLTQIEKSDISWYKVVSAVASQIGRENCSVVPYELIKKSQTEFIKIFFKFITDLDLDSAIFPPPNNLGASELMMATIDYFDNQFPDIPTRHRRELIALIQKYETKNKLQVSLLSEAIKTEVFRPFVKKRI